MAKGQGILMKVVTDNNMLLFAVPGQVAALAYRSIVKN